MNIATTLLTLVKDIVFQYRHGFHGDAVYRQMVLSIIDHFNVTSFVETGTYRGETAGFIAMSRRVLPVYSIEVNDQSYEFSRMRLRKFSNVMLYKGSSEVVLERLLTGKYFGDLPLFYLDAHWYNYWPLEDEISAISNGVERAIVIIDDFEVPGEPGFEFCVEGGPPECSGRAMMDGRKCHLELIRPRLDINEEIPFPISQV